MNAITVQAKYYKSRDIAVQAQAWGIYVTEKGEARSVMGTVDMVICDGQMVNIAKYWRNW